LTTSDVIQPEIVRALRLVENRNRNLFAVRGQLETQMIGKATDGFNTGACPVESDKLRSKHRSRPLSGQA
jgi:hypothetical protein